MGSIKKNIILNFLYQIVVLCFPLILTPYISRVLGAEGIGTYSFNYSIAHYFVLFAMLGLSNYGVREISSKICENDRKKAFGEIYCVQVITASVAIICYLGYTCITSYDLQLSMVFSLYVCSALFDVTWFYFGIERYKSVLGSNFISRVVSLILIFMFVKDVDDIVQYSTIMMLGIFMPQVVLWGRLHRELLVIKVSAKEALVKHFFPNIKLFIPVIAVSIYKYMDKIMLGLLASFGELGYYENVEKIVNIPVAFVTALGTVMLSRASKLFSTGNIDENVNNIRTSIIVVFIISSSMIFGIFAIAQEFIPLFFGDGYEKCNDLVYVMVPTALFIGLSNVIRTQYILPSGKDSIYIISVCLGAIINLALNILFIPKFAAVGAAIATIIAEFVVFIYQLFKVRKDVQISKEMRMGIGYLVCGFLMFLLLRRINIQEALFSTLIIKVLLGIVFYFFLSLIWTLILHKEILLRR